MRKLFLILFLFSLGFYAQTVFAWDDKTTHPALTQETIEFYNQNFDREITDLEKEWIIQGAIEEDTPPRWINHFWDPIYNEGWTGEHGPESVSEDLLQRFSDVFLSPESAVSAVNWAHNQELQTKYKFYKGNKTWEKAIYEYVKNNDKKEAFLTLGYVLHLVQDMAVPDHTRNDTHPGDSPLENYCTRFTRDVFDFDGSDYSPVVLNNLDDYFKYLATYSNNYFFSKDTINDPKYSKPKIVETSGFKGYGVDKDKSLFWLVYIDRVWNEEEFSYKTVYTLLDNDSYYPILRAYWSRLSREAVISGAGVIDLFFREVEKAQSDHGLLQVPPESGSTIFSAFGEITIFGDWFKKLLGGDIEIPEGVPPGGGPTTLLSGPVLIPEPEPAPALTPVPESVSVPVPAPIPVLSVPTPAPIPTPAPVPSPAPLPASLQGPLFVQLVPVPTGAAGHAVVAPTVAPTIETPEPELEPEPEPDEEEEEKEEEGEDPELFLNTVIINEVAWAGHKHYPHDEWIELYNQSDQVIDLTGWTLYSETDNSPHINLSGTISAGGYYLLERTDDTTISDISADAIYTGALSNGGEVLILSYASTTMDSTTEGGWAGGSTSNYTSMERYLDGDWGSNDTYIKNGLVADGDSINGTPKARNSVAYHITKGNMLDSDKTLSATATPYYFVPATLTITASSTLAVNSGITIKFAPDVGFDVLGSLNVQGDTDNKVLFTNFNASTTWAGIAFNNSNTSPLSYFEIEDANTALTYSNSPMDLHDGEFINNNLGVQINPPEWAQPVSVSNLIFTNTATSSPAEFFCGILPSMPWEVGDCVLMLM